MRNFKLDNSDPILLAISKGDLSAVKDYIKNKNPLPSTLFSCIDVSRQRLSKFTLLEFSAGFNQLQIVEYLLEEYKKTENDCSFSFRTVLWFSEKNDRSLADILVIKKLLEETRINPTEDRNDIISIACKFGYLEVVETLLKDPRVKFTAKEGEDFIHSANEWGHGDIIKILLKDERIDPSFGNNWPLVEACKFGYLEVVATLLKDPRVKFTAKEGEDFIHSASKWGYRDIIKTLLKDERIDPTFGSNWLLQKACKLGYLEIVETLLQDPRVKFTTKEGWNFIHSACDGAGKVFNKVINIEIIQMLLKDERIDPTFGSNWLLQQACKLGYLEIVKTLLEDCRVDCIVNNQALIEALNSNSSNKREIINFLLSIGIGVYYEVLPSSVGTSIDEKLAIWKFDHEIDVIFPVMDEKGLTTYVTTFEEMEECLPKLTLKSLALMDSVIHKPYFKLQRNNRYSELYAACAKQMEDEAAFRLELKLLEKEAFHITLKEKNIEIACKNIIDIAIASLGSSDASLDSSECPEKQQPLLQLQGKYLELTKIGYAYIQHKKYDDALNKLSELVKSNLKRKIENIRKLFNDTIETENTEKSMETGYEKVLEITGSIESILPELHQEWLCRLAEEYLTDHQDDAALEIFELAFNSSLKYINRKTTNDGLKYMEIAVLGMINIFQEKIRTEGDQLKWANFRILLDKIIETVFDKVKLKSEILSKMKTILNPFFSNYLWADHKMVLEDLSLEDLVKSYRASIEENNPFLNVDTSSFSDAPIFNPDAIPESENQNFPAKAGLLHSYEAHKKQKPVAKIPQSLSEEEVLSKEEENPIPRGEGKEETPESAMRKMGKK